MSGRKPSDTATRRSGMLVAFLAAVFAVLALGQAAAARAEPPPGTWTQVLNEEFNANGLNTALWTPEWQGAMNGQCTSPNLVSQPGNGYLYLRIKAEASTCSSNGTKDYGSLIESNPADGRAGHTGFLYSYGYVEWRVFIVGSGEIPDWPAVWSFPESQENEIDTMEGLHGKACHTWHHHVAPIEETQGCQTGSYTGWHTYGVDWEPGVLKFYYDGAQVGEVKSAYINSTPQYLIADEVPSGSYGGKLAVPEEIVVDYVRVWQHPGSGSRIGLINNEGNSYVKEGSLDAPYEFEGAGKSIALSGNRIGLINLEGNSFVKEGALNAPYVFEAAGKSIALDGNRIGLINLENDSFVKEGALNAPYEFEAAGTQIALSGNRIGLINLEGDSFVKEGALNAPYEFEAAAKSIVLSGNRIGIINLEGYSYVKEGALNAPYVFEGTAKSIALSGNRIGIINLEGDSYVKEGALNAPYEFEGTAKSVALSGSRIGIINLEGYSYVKEGALNAPYVFEGTGKSLALEE